jgi:hypothetical protein
VEDGVPVCLGRAGEVVMLKCVMEKKIMKEEHGTVYHDAMVRSATNAPLGLISSRLGGRPLQEQRRLLSG